MYQIEYTGTPPGKLVYELQRNHAVTGKRSRMAIRVDYPKAGFIKVYRELGLEGSADKTKEVECEVAYDDKPDSQFLTMAECGKCRWIPVENVLEFVITSECMVSTQADDSLYGMVEINWSFDEFFSAGGNSMFADRLASSLGVHSSRIKIVGVLSGSTIVHYFITKDEELEADPEKAKFELRELNDMVQSLF